MDIAIANIEFVNNFLIKTTPNKYLQALVIFLGFIFIAEFVMLIFEKLFIRIVKKTKTELDDQLVKKTKNPISFMFIFLGINLAIIHLNLQSTIGSFIYKINFALIIISIIYVFISFLKALIDFYIERMAKKTKTRVNHDLARLGKRVMDIIFFFSIIIVILKVWQIEIGPLLTGLGIGGIAIAFAMQKSLGNIFGGISLVLDKSISVGDKIILDQQRMGTILDIGIRSTQIQTYDNEVIIIPNGKLEEMEIQNAAKHGEHVRIVIPFSIAYKSDVKKVKRIVEKVLTKVNDVKTDEYVPFVNLLEMKESSLSFNAYFWINDFRNKLTAIDQATTMIYETLRKNGIQIPYPQMDVHLKKK